MRKPFERKDPHHEIRPLAGKPMVVYLTLGIEDKRLPWVAKPDIHELLSDVWREATAWCVADYMLMPDHIHFFAYPGMLEYPLKRWMAYWKREFTLAHPHAQHRFQTDYWDMTIRSVTQYSEKLSYMHMNPVRKGLVGHPEEWPYQGVIHEFVWIEH